MSEHFEIDLESELIEIDGAWLSRSDLSNRITQKIAAGDFKVSRLAGALEALDQEIAAAKTVTFRVSAATFAKLEAAGQALGRSPSTYARDLLEQVLKGSAPSASAPPAVSTDPVVLTPKKLVEEAADALVLTPKKRAAEVIADAAQASTNAASPSPAADVVLDLGLSAKKSKGKGG